MIWLVAAGLGSAAAVALIAAASRRNLLYLIIGLACGGAAIVVAFAAVSRDPDTLQPDPNPSASFRIVALGDSYISGEGAARFLAKTDNPGSNECRRASTAYPYLVANALKASLIFVACSGATTGHLTGVDASGKPVRPQYPNSPHDVFGGRPQIEVLAATEDPDAVLVSIGGNDAGFKEIALGCALPTSPDCRSSADRWIRRLDREVFPALVGTYRAVRRAASEAEVFALTYPNPLGHKWCSDIWLNSAEFDFLRGVFIPRLNTIIRAAASAVPVRVIDLARSLDGYRICEKPLPQAALNFVSVGRTRGSPLVLSPSGLRGLARGSFHPNPLGHKQMSKKVKRRLRAARDGRLEPLGRGSPPDLPPPPFVPGEVGPPAAPHPFPKGTDCSGRNIAIVSPVSVPEGTDAVSLAGVKPRSLVCYRDYRGEWRSTSADASGRVRVPVSLRFPGIGSINEILVQRPSDDWRKLVVSRSTGGGSN
jgi:lysophospholipase L1-like esterase